MVHKTPLSYQNPPKNNWNLQKTTRTTQGDMINFHRFFFRGVFWVFFGGFMVVFWGFFGVFWSRVTLRSDFFWELKRTRFLLRLRWSSRNILTRTDICTLIHWARSKNPLVDKKWFIKPLSHIKKTPKNNWNLQKTTRMPPPGVYLILSVCVLLYSGIKQKTPWWIKIGS